MSTSLAVQPAYRASKSERSKANPGRTIFGTTLDDFNTCWNLLNDPKVVQEAEDAYKNKLKWIPGNPSPQKNILTTWKQREKKQILIEEEFKKKYEKLSKVQAGFLADSQRIQTKSPIKKFKSEKKNLSTSHLLPHIPTSKTCTCTTSASSRSVTPANSAKTSLNVEEKSSFSQVRRIKQRPMSEPARVRRSNTNIQIPRFRLPPGATNFMRTSSMKITETGAKDLLNAQPINKVGLGDTLQYNYQDFQRRKYPKIYRDNGHVLLLGQRFTDRTTNMEESAPGGFYKANAPDRYINERFPYIKDRKSEATMMHPKPEKHQIKIKANEVADKEDQFVEYEIPLNILHKFGEKTVTEALQENQEEFIDALYKETDLKHSALVPPRINVKELNYPIDPPTTYFSNFGENLKYDKFEGGLHLYIK